MKGFIKGIMSLAASLLLASCTYRDLKAVERTMETDPVIADSLLAAFSMPERGRSQALYALLKTQIDYKMYRDADSDSLIRVATDYYGRKYKGYHAAMAWYSLGCISAELGNDSTAADAYLSALSLFPDTLVRYYALAEQNLSYIFLEHNMDDEAIQLIKSCRFNACRLADSAAIAFCDYNIGKYYLYNNKYDEAQTLFLELKDNKWLSPTTEFEPLLQLSKIELFKNNNYDEALKYIDSYILNNHSTPRGAAYTTKANIYKSMNQFDSALFYYNLSLKETDDPYTICNTYRYLAEIHSINGDQDSSTYYTRQVAKVTDLIVSTSNSESIHRALLIYSQLYPEPTKYSNFIFNISIIIIVIISFILLYGYKNNQLPVSNKQSNHEVNLSDVKQETNLDKDTLGVEICSFKHSKLFETMVSVTAVQEELTGRQKIDFKNNFRRSFLELRAYLAASYNMNEDEIDFCIYTLLGFKPKDFSKLSSNNHHRMIKYRLKEKIPVSLFDYIFNSQHSF